MRFWIFKRGLAAAAALLALVGLALLFRHPIGEFCQKPSRQWDGGKWDGTTWREPADLSTCLEVIR